MPPPHEKQNLLKNRNNHWHNNVPVHGIRPSTSIESLKSHKSHIEFEGDNDEDPKQLTADGVLNSYGASNPYQILIFCTMALIWTIMALPLLVSAFFIGNICLDERNCTLTPGSLIEEFGLVGAKAQHADYSSMIFVLGNMVGASTISRFSDLKGRRPALLISLTGLGFFGVLSAFSPSIVVFTMFRFVQGIFLPGCGMTNWVLAYESTSMKLRSYSALVFGLFWVVGYFVLAPLCYYLVSWRHQIIGSSLPALVIGILYYFFVPESFHFMVSNGRVVQLKQWYRNANRYAKVARDESEVELLVKRHYGGKSEGDDKKDDGFLCSLMKQKVLLMYTAVLGYLWTCDSFVYYGLSLISTTLAGNRYVNFVLAGLVEIPSYIVSPYLLEVMGRRGFVAFVHLITSLAFVGTVFIADETVSLVFWLIGKFGIACAYTSLYVYGSEVFPTVLRSGCIGICLFLERIGGITAPMVRSMSVISPNLPNVFFAVTAGVAAGLTLLLPETRGLELPDLTSEIAEPPERKISRAASRRHTASVN
ncbi:unnamed protein product [Bursaphelenchus okinawaensis]|uniref:Major facilitator superfamily (MFS) profile domain-containing protein n=1 Tax=Bursaphelenchus okinawaensis TaxID=465554 RepID=A0A811K423_9BILA|nr:unnamed protein product [Bursaphelenchus okinawaensis]CAG9090253.1 unnamed protein product [Bursaphelenchus okinawaensis]